MALHIATGVVRRPLVAMGVAGGEIDLLDHWSPSAIADAGAIIIPPIVTICGPNELDMCDVSKEISRYLDSAHQQSNEFIDTFYSDLENQVNSQISNILSLDDSGRIVYTLKEEASPPPPVIIPPPPPVIIPPTIMLPPVLGYQRARHLCAFKRSGSFKPPHSAALSCINRKKPF